MADSGVMKKAKNAVSSAAKSTASAFMKGYAKVTESFDDSLPGWVPILFIAILFVCLIVWLKFRGTFETPNNIRDMVLARLADSTSIAISQMEPTRKGLEAYLRPCENVTNGDGDQCKGDFATDVPPNVSILSNFHFATVNVAGLFFPLALSGANPSEMEYVFSPEAIKVACQGGARAFVLEIWPSMDPKGGFRPILQVVQDGSNWRRISMNTMEFSTALQTIIENVYGGKLTGSTQSDICVLYLRFQGKPRDATYRQVASALAKHAQPYLLDPTFAYGRGMKNDRLMNTNIRDLKGKIILVCNKTRADLEKEAPTLYPFMNMCPEESKKVEYTLADLENITDPKSTQNYIKSSLTFLALPPTDKRAQSNEWIFGKAYNMGIHCIAMNFFNRESNMAAAYFEIFSPYSYKLKNPSLYKLVSIVQEPPVSTDAGIGTGTLRNNTAIDPMAGLDTCIAPFNELVRIYTEAMNEDNLGAYSGRVRNDQKPEVQRIRQIFDARITPEQTRFDSNNCSQDSARATEIRNLALNYQNKLKELLGL